MPPDRIRDIPKFRELIANVRNLSQFRRAFPVLKPILRTLGIDVSSVETAFDDMDFDRLKARTEALISTPDRFNELFADRGWIIYGAMNLEVAREAIEAAGDEGVDAGEQVLLGYYDPDTVAFHLNRMEAVDAFRPRMRLARKALDDYREERFHACVPVVLALLDGLVQELHAVSHGDARAFSSEEADLTAWDSIAGHSAGLERLASLMRKGRRKTRTDDLTVPYRHGIMHGMDLGYDNRHVAAKTWAALFAVREWALKAEQEELEEPEEKEEDEDLSFVDALERYREVQERRRKLDQWEPRRVTVGEDVPDSGSPEDYPPNTPTRALVEFLTYWMQDNYGFMADALKHVGTGNPVDPGRIRGEFEHTTLDSFKIVAVEDFSPACTDITVDLERRVFDSDDQARVQVRMTHMRDDGSPAAFGVENGNWYLTTRVKLISPGQEGDETGD